MNWRVSQPGAFALYFRPNSRAFDSLIAPAPGNWPSKEKKKGKFPAISRGEGGGGEAVRNWN